MRFVDDSMDELINKRSKTGAPVKYTVVANRLADNPGAWANVTEDFSNVKNLYVTATQINKGRLSAFSPEGSFESCMVDGELYARAVER